MYLPCGSPWFEDECGNLQGQVVNVRGTKHQSMTTHGHAFDAACETCTHMQLPHSLARFEGKHRNLQRENLQWEVVNVRGVDNQSATTDAYASDAAGEIHVCMHLPCGSSEHRSLQRKVVDVRCTEHQSTMMMHAPGSDVVGETHAQAAEQHGSGCLDGKCDSPQR